MNINKIASWALIVVVLVIGGAFAWHLYSTRVIVHEFSGTLTQKSATTLTVKGFYNTTDYPDAANPTRDVTVTVTPTTKFTKVSYHLPTVAESQATNGFHLESLPHEYASGSLDELGQTNGNTQTIVILSDENIYGKSSFTASSIEYKALIFPK